MAPPFVAHIVAWNQCVLFIVTEILAHAYETTPLPPDSLLGEVRRRASESRISETSGMGVRRGGGQGDVPLLDMDVCKKN